MNINLDDYIASSEIVFMQANYVAALEKAKQAISINQKYSDAYQCAYSGNSTRPSSFKVSFKIDGIKTNKTFIN